MLHASEIFDDGERRAIGDAVREAESRTVGEIVPVVATTSARYVGGADRVGHLCALSAVIGLWWAWPDPEGWGEQAQLEFPMILGAMIGGYLVGRLLAFVKPKLRLLLLPRGGVARAVSRAAVGAFWKFRVRRTRGGTGILLYISLLERRVVVLGDDAIAGRIDQPEWNRVRDVMLRHLGDGDPTKALLEGIALAGELLAELLPGEGPDQLHNDLRIVD
ncbi:MAG: TPM domain-containing protein [Planctomycetota bacterium]|jgi:putative membrane protein